MKNDREGKINRQGVRKPIVINMHIIGVPGWRRARDGKTFPNFMKIVNSQI